MPIYTYRARDGNGDLVRGQTEGSSTDEVARELQDLGYLPVQIRRRMGSSYRLSIDPRVRVKTVDLILFTRQFATMVRTGVPLIRGLQTLREQAQSVGMRDIISSLLKAVQEGESLGDAMKGHPDVFSPVYINTIKAGEASGKLEEILIRLADFLEYDQKVKEEIKSATRYPVIVIVVMVLAFFFLVTFVIPKFSQVYARFEMDLPLPTRILIATNAAIREYWHVNLILFVLAVIGVRFMLKTSWGRRLWDSFKIRVPIIGPITFKGIISRFARMFATLSGSGVPILETLEIIRVAVGNSVIGDKIGRIRRQVMEGSGIALPMNQEEGFPPLLVQMISVGEETGALEDMLSEVARHYETEIDYSLRRLTTSIEPILIICIGGMMLLMALAVFMPLWNLVDLTRR
jgi:type II secretory pathway component PulF